MGDHSGLQYLFDQPNLNARKARWLATISEFYFDIRDIKGNEKRINKKQKTKSRANLQSKVASSKQKA